MNDDGLVLAAEDCEETDFVRLHRFTEYEDRIIKSLMAHGPVLLRGGRGSGKSALLIEATRRARISLPTALPVYLSLRHLPLLQSTGNDYQQFFTRLLVEAVNEALSSTGSAEQLASGIGPEDIRSALVGLASKINKRLILMFDDAAHIGRETDLGDFFGLFRTLSGNGVSCKAAIYPGVTKFGTRFDVYNDATVIDLARDERTPAFSEFFREVIAARYTGLESRFTKSVLVDEERIFRFLGRAVLGNARAFIFTCNILSEHETIGLNELTSSFVKLGADYYWPLLDELKPKLGIYEPLLDPAQEVAERLFKHLAEKRATSVLLHKDHQHRLVKVLEILEYVGFISRREASRALKSGGRGGRYASNLCTLLDHVPQRRITQDLFLDWSAATDEPAEIYSANDVLNVSVPEPDLSRNLAVLALGIEVLGNRNVYPYGLTEQKIRTLRDAGIVTIADLATAPDEDLRKLSGIGTKFFFRIKNTVAQAIWM
ncbi:MULTISPECIES: helix-hairpin-helix domain-containing protein [Burkholderia]|jgi:hypothetical protein|uniref:helix-hairpin-helix domain-containing protein n=3 Tax=Bacteria TaxID=2 RepID=UPI00086C8545|nr:MULTISPECIES: helix-hairpin-helix domain-containing protein [Burkholderia]MDP9546574.1 hypothetical protein [Burkholderia cepacia]MBR8392791.1 helix-hairpin-helix domain-containing protein [Burkholderia cenocepacia]MBR8470214.1 helix-hairpin-helix domain-containing protein [Burkholderia cenocepacia]MBR8492547.1 helix-hairpin-helix domain-containing protein [Burkholderia cenocepacia]MDO5918920.1 helix-hairpin-helix domain-containing protein [Burkholderia cenocepacia]